MQLSNIIAAAALLCSVAAGPVDKTPKCGPKQYGPCRCPTGTDYSESATSQYIGASVRDVAAVVNDFFHPDWLGAAPFSTTGKDNTVGAIRSTWFPTPIGVYNITETLTEYKVNGDGAFRQVFEQTPSSVPVPYKSGNGSFSGYWVTLEAFPIFQYETLVRWSIYACETGHARNFAKFHEGALKNATSILQNSGKILGINSAGFSAQAF